MNLNTSKVSFSNHILDDFSLDIMMFHVNAFLEGRMALFFIIFIPIHCRGLALIDDCKTLVPQRSTVSTIKTLDMYIHFFKKKKTLKVLHLLARCGS